MLDLPQGTPMFPPEAVWLRRILQADGSLWRSSPDADVLVLGDSFSNIYTLESMGWGTSAGFVEQLSYLLRRPIDRLLQNDQGAFATREMLHRDRSRLDGKRVVVYQFAVRELMFGDWKVLDLSAR
jgi:alginate O-acetyltransferase complex protein AlgJ